MKALFFLAGLLVIGILGLLLLARRKKDPVSFDPIPVDEAVASDPSMNSSSNRSTEAPDAPGVSAGVSTASVLASTSNLNFLGRTEAEKARQMAIMMHAFNYGSACPGNRDLAVTLMPSTVGASLIVDNASQEAVDLRIVIAELLLRDDAVPPRYVPPQDFDLLVETDGVYALDGSDTRYDPGQPRALPFLERDGPMALRVIGRAVNDGSVIDRAVTQRGEWKSTIHIVCPHHQKYGAHTHTQEVRFAWHGDGLETR